MQKFLLSIDPVNKELFILHREYPACLIEVRQETPLRFIVQDLFDDMDDPNEILNMSFVQEAKDFFRDYAANIYPKN